MNKQEIYRFIVDSENLLIIRRDVSQEIEKVSEEYGKCSCGNLVLTEIYAMRDPDGTTWIDRRTKVCDWR